MDQGKTQENPYSDLGEKGRGTDGPRTLDRRLFMQLLVYGGCREISSVTGAGVDAQN